MSAQGQKINPSLWFDRQAEEAARFYSSVIENSRVGPVTRAGKVGSEITGLAEGTVMSVEFELGGLKFAAINGGPLFKFNPSVSFLVACDSLAKTDEVWSKLSQGGSVLMEFGRYPFSERYGWTQDRYGLSWQVMYSGDRPARQKITPTLMFVGKQYCKAEEAINYYLRVFKNSMIGAILRYSRGMEPDKEGTIQHADFALDGTSFAAMDSAGSHEFGFNEAISFQVPCATQAEVDYYWGKLTGDGGQEGMCGWLKDKFGLSWQVVPNILVKLLRDPDPEKVARVTRVFLKMKKLVIADLEQAVLDIRG
jgi:predicted 3-demethylubiquinone-9 3-methyltransferase (glyoxalase superfamily)